MDELREEEDESLETWVVDNRAAGRLDKSLVAVFPAFSRARLQALIEEGRVLVDGQPAKASDKPMQGQVVEIRVPVAVDIGLVGEDIPLTVLHEDEDLLVIVKPAGMAVHPGAGRNSGTLVNALMGRDIPLSGIGGELRPGIVHRLDVGTSGVMVVAKNDTAHRRLSKQFEVHSIERRYLAIVHKMPNHDRGTCRSELGRDPQNRLKYMSVESGGRSAVTHWTVLSRGDRVSLLECRLETGRTHQIRVHLSEAGFPLIGDRTYTRRDCTPTARLRSAVEALTHPLLHARLLGFQHPRSKENLLFEAAPPADFLAFAALAELAIPPTYMQGR